MYISLRRQTPNGIYICMTGLLSILAGLAPEPPGGPEQRSGCGVCILDYNMLRDIRAQHTLIDLMLST